MKTVGIRRVVHALRFPQRAIRRVLADAEGAPERATVYSHPVTAIYHGGRVFDAEIKNCVHPQGFSYGVDGWHFLTAGLTEYVRTGSKEQAVAALQEMVKAIPLNNALEALNANLQGPSLLRWRSAAGSRNLVPWSIADPNEVSRRAARVRHEEGLIRPGTSVLESIHDHEWKAKNHIERLVAVYESIRDKGYHPEGAESEVYALGSRNTYRFCVFGGQHRLAALSVLGYRYVRARLKVPVIIRESEMPHWPLVRCGLWSHEDARQYFRHLIQFDSAAWARDRGFSRKPLPSA